MGFPNINLKLVGAIVAFDAETGDVLHFHQKFVETVDGMPGYSEDITPMSTRKFAQKPRAAIRAGAWTSSWRLPNSASAKARLSCATMLIP